ncbi:hypothetical protein IFM89_031394 [Coptis chinensis]|uniref:1-(5-phosphoribosyl)-5-[(5-phosphoribosylamino)methylideneamino] imidazole-4-carboxamide isomerase HISN3, chloroplastic n=1 Tax=Coptis chinensis TaxID=261450 RepID=A0A835HFA3_9MAGN|nr:hypothetical protein IFM89_031394 [Coptis chinensis]
MAGSFRQWESDPLFSAAEVVQDSADRMESIYRNLLHEQSLVEAESTSLDYHRRDLATALGTTKWQPSGFNDEIIELRTEEIEDPRENGVMHIDHSFDNIKEDKLRKVASNYFTRPGFETVISIEDSSKNTQGGSWELENPDSNAKNIFSKNKLRGSRSRLDVFSFLGNMWYAYGDKMAKSFAKRRKDGEVIGDFDQNPSSSYADILQAEQFPVCMCYSRKEDSMIRLSDYLLKDESSGLGCSDRGLMDDFLSFLSLFSVPFGVSKHLKKECCYLYWSENGLSASTHCVRFRPCIDIHKGKVKQIVGSTLHDLKDGGGSDLVTNFESDKSAAQYADLYKKDGLTGGHVIMLGGDDLSRAAAIDALLAYPGGLQVGGGINSDNALSYIEKGASHVIVTSYVFNNGHMDLQRLKDLVCNIGRRRLVLDLSCRKKGGKYAIVTDRWQKFSNVYLDEETLEFLAVHADEFLVHGVDVEGKRLGIDEELVALLGRHSPIPVTYAGGVMTMADLERIKVAGAGRVDVTVGSALDIFGGDITYKDVVAWHKKQESVAV